MKSASDDIEAIIRDLGLEKELALQRIRSHLSRLFNTHLAKEIYPETFKEGELLLRVSSRQVLMALRAVEDQLLGQLGPFGVKRLRFRIGRVPKRSHTVVRRREPVTLPDDVVSGVEASVRDVALRKAILKAMAASDTFRSR